MAVVSFWDSFRRYERFAREEVHGFVISVLVLAFIFSFNDWGEQVFDLAVGIRNYIIAIVAVGISLYVHHIAQRMWGAHKGYKAEQRVWWYGLAGSLLVLIFSVGKIQIYAASGLFMHHLAGARLGYFRYGPNPWDWGIMALWGPLANVLLAGIAKTIALAFPSFFLAPFLDKLFFFNMAFAAYNLLPIPPLDGSRLFFASRLMYVFIAGTILSYVLMILLLGIYSYILALLIGGLFWAVFFFGFERKWS